VSRFLLTLSAALISTSCGYHVAGKADLVPKRIQTIAIPAFTNNTQRHKLSERLPAALTREFITRTRYKIVPDANQAEAVLNGAVLNYFNFPTVFDPQSGRASNVQISVILSINLTDRSNGALLFNRSNFEVRERYEISVDPVAYFDESDAGLERLSRDVARSVVSAVLENF
jgi:hypothetical protein